MRGFRFVLAMCAGVLVASPALVSAASAGTGSPWGTAIEVPGFEALNTGAGGGFLSSLSCPSSGNCAAGGSYSDSSGSSQAFVVNETGGVWGNAIEPPGFSALNAGGNGHIASVSCSSPGNCAAGGTYSDSSGNNQTLVVNETGGVWGQAIEVPGTAALNAGGNAFLDSLSCAPGAALDCAAAGSYADSAGSWHAFVAGETGGVWGQAIEVPGTAALNQGGLASADEVSCPSPGNCTVGGLYTRSTGNQQPFIASERGGVWGQAIDVPGTAALNKGEFASVNALSCTSPGNCSAVGIYTPSVPTAPEERQVYVADEKNGTWAPATQMPGLAALNVRDWSGVNSMSCTSAGTCAAGGFYEDSLGIAQAFVINEAHGTWGQAIELPGTAALDKGSESPVVSVSCVSAGNCVAGGYYVSYEGRYHVHLRAFVADQTGGVWRRAEQVPGTAALNTGENARVSTVSCARAGSCALGGSYAAGTLTASRPFADTQG